MLPHLTVAAASLAARTSTFSIVGRLRKKLDCFAPSAPRRRGPQGVLAVLPHLGRHRKCQTSSVPCAWRTTQWWPALLAQSTNRYAGNARHPPLCRVWLPGERITLVTIFYLPGKPPLAAAREIERGAAYESLFFCMFMSHFGGARTCQVASQGTGLLSCVTVPPRLQDLPQICGKTLSSSCR